MPAPPTARVLVALAALALPLAAVPAGAAGPARAGVAGGAAAVASGAACAAAPTLLRSPPVAFWRPAPGVTVRAWQGRDDRARPVRLTVARAELSRVRVAAATASRQGAASSTVAMTAATAGAVAGVNADYFRYDSDGRAVPLGVQVRGGVVHRVPVGRTRFVGVGPDGRIRSGLARVGGSAVLPAPRPGASPRTLSLAAVNPDRLPASGLVVVTGYLGAARPRAAWEVVVRDGRVVWSGHRAPFGVRSRFGAATSVRSGVRTGREVVLAGTGAAAAPLRTLRPGMRVRVRWAARSQDGTRLVDAVGTGAPMLRGGRSLASCSGAGRLSRARTLVAWDGDRGLAWFVTVRGGTGRGAAGSWGLTYAQVTELARRLGAREAVMVDGGGSTTLAVRGPGGRVQRVDAHARAAQRPVPNGLVLVPRR
jgi:hypothetical protein